MKKGGNGAHLGSMNEARVEDCAATTKGTSAKLDDINFNDCITPARDKDVTAQATEAMRVALNRRDGLLVDVDNLKKIVGDTTTDRVSRFGTRYIMSPDVLFDWINELAEDANARKISGDHSKKAGPSRYYFRGERSNSYDLLPPLRRQHIYELLRDRLSITETLGLQRKVLDRYKRYTQHIINTDGDLKASQYFDFDLLCLAQHHQLPTLLLDWSLNAYVALYFAVSKARELQLAAPFDIADKAPVSHAVRIWVMKLKPSEVRQETTIHLENRTGEWDNFIGHSDRIPSYPNIVVPLVFTRRIAAQSGRFVYCGFMDRYQVNDKQKSLLRYSMETYWGKENPPADELPWDSLYSLDIMFEGQGVIDLVKNMEKVLVRLEFMGFHAGRLFPDLGGWAQYLAEGNL